MVPVIGVTALAQRVFDFEQVVTGRGTVAMAMKWKVILRLFFIIFFCETARNSTKPYYTQKRQRVKMQFLRRGLALVRISHFFIII